MGKIYKALEKFKTETDSGQPDAVLHDPAETGVAAASPAFTAVHEQMPGSRLPLDQNLVVLNDPLSYASEQFKILRTHLLFPHKGSPPRTIMVTSAMQGDGKSFTAANLAISIAQSINDHVLLIDCDMRRPVQNQIFGFGQVEGLSDHLAGRRKLEDILLKTPVPKLTLIPGGTLLPNPSELLSSNEMSALLLEVKNRYNDRFIIVDTPPPHLTAETSALANQVDSILIVMRYLKTPRAQIETLVEKLGKEKIIGILLNQFDKPLQKYHGYQYYQADISS